MSWGKKILLIWCAFAMAGCSNSFQNADNFVLSAEPSFDQAKSISSSSFSASGTMKSCISFTW